MVSDPVCGMELDTVVAPAQAEYQGRMYYFCSDACKQQFEEHPELYTRAEAA